MLLGSVEVEVGEERRSVGGAELIWFYGTARGGDGCRCNLQTRTSLYLLALALLTSQRMLECSKSNLTQVC